MTAAYSAHQNADNAVLACVARYPQGISIEMVQASVGAESCETAIASARTQGWIERSPIYVDRLRWARRDGPFERAAAWVRLRTRAKPLLACIYEHSGLPVTLHVLVGRAHAVIERFPSAPHAAIAEEVSRYSTPRALTNGMTSKVLLACLPPECDEAKLVESGERDPIRHLGYGYAPSAKAGRGGVLSAPVRAASNGFPLAALCTFGESQRLSPDRVDEIGPVMREAADRLATESRADERLLLERAEALVSRI